MSGLAAYASVPLFVAGVVFALAGLIVVFLGFARLFERRPFGFVVRLLFGAALALAGLLAVALVVGVQGYRALTQEVVAAHITVSPRGEQRFDAEVRFPDGRRLRYALAGDEIYVDAHILKWTPAANLLGLHTAYALDRIAGRYRRIEDERDALRTVHALAAERPLDLFELRRRHAWLAPLFDAEYGSATFVPADRPVELEVRVSTSGLLIRETARRG
ncbi:MAG: hypothetical protein R3357_11985 [Burkholderiales bacterium]|nr:hypothetical protein [Burkholderiales bacterium]